MTTTLNIASPYDTSCIVQARWDYSTESSVNKYSSEYQAYRLQEPYKILDSEGNFLSYGRAVVTRKAKIRGRGNALSIRFSSEPGKELRLLGWGIPYAGLTDV